MAPPANRRPGYSRRAQYTTFFGYLAGGVGAAIGVALLLVSIRNPGFMAGLRGLGADVAAPVSRTFDSGKAGSDGLLETVAAYFAAGRQNAQLKRELAEAKVRLVAAQAQAEENRRLKGLLGLMQTDPKPLLTTRLIGSTSASIRRFATLGAGASNGVAVGMPVRSPRGLVGRVLEVSSSTARVLLITDTESVVPVRRAVDGVPAFAQGRADGTLQIRLINLGINPLKKGDTFVTSGSGGLYRPGTPMAVVRKITSDGAIAQPLSDPAANDYVVVDRAWTPTESLEAQTPAPPPASTPATEAAQP